MGTTRSRNPNGLLESQIGEGLIAFLDFLRRRWPRPVAAGDPALQIDGRDLDETDMFFHVPNGVWTHPRVAASFVAQGLKTGVVDYVWPIAKSVQAVEVGGPFPSGVESFAALGLELKRSRPKGSLSSDQVRFQAAVRELTNWKIVTVWGLWEAARVVQRYGGYPVAALAAIPRDRPPGRIDIDPWDGHLYTGEL